VVACVADEEVAAFRDAPCVPEVRGVVEPVARSYIRLSKLLAVDPDVPGLVFMELLPGQSDDALDQDWADAAQPQRAGCFEHEDVSAAWLAGPEATAECDVSDLPLTAEALALRAMQRRFHRGARNGPATKPALALTRLPEPAAGAQESDSDRSQCKTVSESSGQRRRSNHSKRATVPGQRGNRVSASEALCSARSTKRGSCE
jgi:hypothetical protein